MRLCGSHIILIVVTAECSFTFTYNLIKYYFPKPAIQQSCYCACQYFICNYFYRKETKRFLYTCLIATALHSLKYKYISQKNMQSQIFKHNYYYSTLCLKYEKIKYYYDIIIIIRCTQSQMKASQISHNMVLGMYLLL